MEDYLLEITSSGKQKDFYVCPICHSGEKKKKTAAMHLSIGRDGVPRVTCYSCHGIKSIDGTKEGANIFDLIALVEGFSTFREAYHFAARKYGLENEMNNDLGYDYLTKNRKLSASTIERYRLRFIPTLECVGNDGKRKILHKLIEIPYPNSDFKIYKFINADRMSGSGYYKAPGLKEPVFNSSYIGTEETVFVTESQFCAMSIEQVSGQKAVATGGTGYDKLLEQIDLAGAGRTGFIIAYDNDKAGEREGGHLLEELTKRNIPAVKINISDNFKDPNEALVTAPVAFREAIENAAGELAKSRAPKTVEIINDKQSRLLTLERVNTDQTSYISGFQNFDNEQFLQNGMMNLYGKSGVGKTSFLTQLSEQVARQNEYGVFYCSFSERNSELLNLYIKRYVSRIIMSKKIEAPKTNEDVNKLRNTIALKVKKELSGKLTFMKQTRIVDDVIEALLEYTSIRKKGIIILDSVPSFFMESDFYNVLWELSDERLVIVSSENKINFPFSQIVKADNYSMIPKDFQRGIYKFMLDVEKNISGASEHRFMFEYSPATSIFKMEEDLQ